MIFIGKEKKKNVLKNHQKSLDLNFHAKNSQNLQKVELEFRQKLRQIEGISAFFFFFFLNVEFLAGKFKNKRS